MVPSFTLRVSFLLIFLLLLPNGLRADQASLRKNIGHIIVIFQENWSFDGLYGNFPGAEGLGQAQKTPPQKMWNGGRWVPYGAYPQAEPLLKDATVHGPFDLAPFLQGGDPARTMDLVHRFYIEKAQVDDGLMDRFVYYSNAQGLAMSYVDAKDLPEGRLAAKYTLCDRFFHGAFGGSFLNHHWLIACRAPAVGSTAIPAFSPSPTPAEAANPPDPDFYVSGGVTYAVNTVFSSLPPRNPKGKVFLEPLANDTIGKRLTEKGVTWKWYAGGWDEVNDPASTPESLKALNFQYHHQPFAYYKDEAMGVAKGKSREDYLGDDGDFEEDLEAGTLPQVCWVKPEADENEHPNYSSLQKGQEYVERMVRMVQAKKEVWDHCLIIVTYDENGGRWDHVPPPGTKAAKEDPGELGAYSRRKGTSDEWGPGTRVPCILISPYVAQDPEGKKPHLDHHIYETTSILKTIEERFDITEPLGQRDRCVDSFAGAVLSENQEKGK